MENNHAPFYAFDTHVQAEEAIQTLNKAGFDVKKLSLVGKGYHSEEHPLGFYTKGDRIKAWGGHGCVLGWRVGRTAGAGGLLSSRHRTGCNGRACGHSARGRAGRRRGSGRCLSHRRCAVADRRFDGSGDQVRDSVKGRQVRPHGARHCTRPGEGTVRALQCQGLGSRLAGGAGCSLQSEQRVVRKLV